MGIKEEIRQAKQQAQYLKDKGLSLDEIMINLNVEFDGFYHVVKGQVVRDNEPDYLPYIVIA